MKKFLSQNEPLAGHCFYQIGGPAKFYARPKTSSDLIELAEWVSSEGHELFFLGAGSNLLISDRGFEGCVIDLRDYQWRDQEIEISSTQVHARAQVGLTKLMKATFRAGLSGLECLTGIPGQVGGAVAMNAGTELGEVGHVTRRIFGFQFGSRADFFETQCKPSDFSYRKNLLLKPGQLILGVQFDLVPGDPLALEAKASTFLAERKRLQPLGQPSCGSVFKNPPGDRAWSVIDRLGLRGHRLGNAQVSEKHSNWILNLGGAKASEVWALIQLIQRRARDELGILLEPEVRWVGHAEV